MRVPRRPGNVSELHDILAVAIARAGSDLIRAEHLPDPLTTAAGASNRLRALVADWVGRATEHDREPAGLHADLLAVAELALFTAVLRQIDGCRLPAARWLEPSRATVRKMLREKAP